MKESIVQEDRFGCGIACVAFVKNRAYQKVVGELGTRKAETVGFWCKELVSHLGVKYTFKYLKQNLKGKIYQDNVIVFIIRSKRYPFGHYLVRYQGSWMDPWINLPKNKNIKEAKSGFRKRLPGRPVYAIFSK